MTRADRIKRMIVLLLSVLLITGLLSGCGKTDEIHVMQIWENEEAGAEEEEEPLEGNPGAGMIVAMVTDEGRINDASFNQGVWEGLQDFSVRSGAKIRYTETEKKDDLPANFQQLTDEGCDLIWGVGYNCQEALFACAKENPGTQYALVDSSPSDLPANVTGVAFRAQESSFLAGYIAGAMTKTGKLGFVGGSRIDSVDSFRYGFMGGAAYAAGIYGKEVDFFAEYTGGFDDPDLGYEIARKLYAQGCDIILHAAGGSGTGVIEAARDTDHYVIGADRDQSYLAPEHVLTSSMKNVDVAAKRVSESYAMGEKTGGTVLSLGLTEGAVGIPAEHKNYRDEIYDAVLLVEDSIKSGQITAPATAEEYESFTENIGGGK
ncbi:MAG: BMP family ABC transporter substrate-binding protein [Lachnospiraceae bacterium]|nr:BMP family ABC transporter substrate-binding protein [Lachnospiraceae bacterium]